MVWPNSPSNIQLPGQRGLTGDEEALFKEQFIPNVMMLYYAICRLEGFFKTKPLSGANRYTETLMGRTEVKVQQARGDYLQSEVIENAEITVGLDKPEYAKVAIPQADKLKTQILIDPEYRKRMAKAMAKYKEGRRICELAKAARATHALTSEVGGTVISGVNLSTATALEDKGKMLYDAIGEGVKVFRDKDIDEDLNILITQSHVQALKEYTKVGNSDWGNVAQSQNEGLGPTIHGVNIIVSNHANMLYGTNVTSIQNHEVDMTNTTALMFASDAIIETSLYQDKWAFIDDDDRLEYRIQVSAVQGAGTYNPSCALELSSAA